MSVSQHIPANIKRVSKSLGYALWLDNFDDWAGFSIITRASLDDRQRAALSFMALKAQDATDAHLTAQVALSEGAGQPMVPLFNYLDEAAFWADWAAPDELDTYCLACFNRMAAHRQTAFLEFVQRRAAA